MTSKNNRRSHTLAHEDFPDDRYPKSQIYTAELILVTFECTQGGKNVSVYLMITVQKHANIF
jgi:hypothetical protein